MGRLVFLCCLIFTMNIFAADDVCRWPEFTSTMRPWTRWWWHGNAVDMADIDRHLREFARVGIGGVEITGIYGVKGMEQKSIPYLSPAFLEILNETAKRAAALELGVDIPPGSGWRCGGPALAIEDADAVVVFDKIKIKPGENFRRAFEAPPQALMAFADLGKKINLISLLKNDSSIDWQAPAGDWTIYIVTQKWSGAKVKRPAPGGEGYAFNPYSKQATERMLQPFSAAFDQVDQKNIRSIFHDSFEYAGNWTKDFFIEFENRRGYDLRDYVPELAGKGDAEIIRRVKCDYRETISDLVLEDFIQPLQKWSHARGWQLRNQSHGSPANLLDLYGYVDIPETEIFRFDRDPRVLKFASSAANVTGKNLVSSESFTWQDEHFHVTLDTMKRSADLLFASGVNHIFFHGTAYSPEDAAWPGWVFYASSQINPQNPLWRDLPAFNAYITRCQSLLQTSAPDNDVLIYWPVYDIWSDSSGFNKMLAIHHAQWISENPSGRVAAKLAQSGISYDFISDKQIDLLRASDGRLAAGGLFYQTIILPECEFLPLETLNNLVELAKSGATIVVENKLPDNVPGLHNWQARQKMLSEMRVQLKPGESGQCKIGAGNLIYADDLVGSLAKINIKGEEFAKNEKLLWLRKKHANGYLYFIANHGAKVFDGWLPLKREFAVALIFDPLTGEICQAAVKGNSAYVQLQAGQSILLKIFNEKIKEPGFRYWQAAGESAKIKGEWSVSFVKGGPALPQSFTQKELTSWTVNGDPETERFAGTACYSITFDSPMRYKSTFSLDLGKVAASAQVVLNGQPVGTLFARPFSMDVELNPGQNKLEIYVTNLAANRVRDLDRRGVEWRIFEDINFVNIDYQPFDASNWPVLESGLLGPVTLTPLTNLEP